MYEDETIDRDRIVRKWSRKIVEKLQVILPTNPVEADFRHAVEPFLDQFCEEIGVNPLVHVEYTLATGRADAIFNRFVIEYERPGVLRESLYNRATDHAVGQVKDYISGLAKRERHKLQRLAGVAFDGHYLIFVRFVNKQWSIEPPIDVNEYSLDRFLTWLAGLSSGIALTAEKLNQDFSIEQLRTQNILRSLSKSLDSVLSDPGGIVPKLFEQWRLLFSESIDYSETFGGRKLELLRKWVRKAGIDVKTPNETERFFFALHTYFALLVKFLAWLALSRHLAVKLGAPSFSELFTADSETLQHRLREMESGGIFRAYGITNLLEGDFFLWYLHAWDHQTEDALRDMLKRLDEYDPTTLAIIPEETRDLFKKLYHYLLPREVRHNLGEYYTPDWLAQRLLNQVDNEFFMDDPHRTEVRFRSKIRTTRFLDPACGSGTFLILTIARMRELGEALMINETELLNTILENVVGIDLNPLAVLTARVNYLLAIADLLEYRRGDITIPLYLADSVRTPAMGENLFTADAYEFPTAIGKFIVPASLCTKERFDHFCDILEEGVQSEMAIESFMKRVQTQLGLVLPEWNERSNSRLEAIYQHLLNLHHQGMDGLWAHLLKNNFAPLTIGQFDYIVGNPPWVNWENLPDGYRSEIKPIWENYGLFPHGGMDTILGKGKKDIAMLMTYVVTDKLLRDDGKLGFVITQSVFKTGGSGQGFRRFRIPLGNRKEIPLRAILVDDMVSLNPFEGASNRTSVIVMEKGKPTKYPVPYTIWRKEKGARFTYDSTLGDVRDATKQLPFVAAPVDERDLTSPWLTARPKALKAAHKVLGKSHYEAHAGVYTGGANAVYWVDIVLKRPDGLVIVRNITEGAKVNVEEVTEPVEPDLLHPLLRGRDVERWKGEPSAFILMVQDPLKRRGIDREKLQEHYPHTYGYLKRFESVLRSRRSRGVSDMIKSGAPFYTMFAVGDYTFSPWKVVWRYIANDFILAVVSSKNDELIIPDHRLIFVPFSNDEEAHYFCATANSSPIRFCVRGFMIETQIAPHVIGKIRVPHFDPKNSVHVQLAALSRQAHEAVQRENIEELKQIEGEIDHQAAKIWGLTSEELVEVQKNLSELSDE